MEKTGNTVESVSLTEAHKQAIRALNTGMGQINGIVTMIEEGRYCIDISNQILAAQAQIRRANKLILLQHLETCVIEAAGSPEDLHAKTEELSAVFDKLMK